MPILTQSLARVHFEREFFERAACVRDVTAAVPGGVCRQRALRLVEVVFATSPPKKRAQRPQERKQAAPSLFLLVRAQTHLLKRTGNDGQS